MEDEGIADLAKIMQDAALDPTLWERALNAINVFTKSAGAVLLSVEARQKYAPTSTDLGEMMDDYFRLGWHANDRRERCIPLLKGRGIVFDHEFQSFEDIENCDYYHDFLARHGRKWFAGVGVEVDGDHWCLALQRRPESEPFDKEDLARLRLLRGALANTAHLSQQIGSTWISGLQYALNVIGKPAILFDHHAHMLGYNDAASLIVKLYFDNERLITKETSEILNQMLHGALHRPIACSSGALGQTLSFGGSIYRCRTISLLGHQGLVACKAAVLLLIEPTVGSPEDIMRERYGLTRAELRVAMALADGKSVQETASDSGLKTDSIRAHLKSIYRKTDVGRQSQLVALIRKLAVPESSRANN